MKNAIRRALQAFLGIADSKPVQSVVEKKGFPLSALINARARAEAGVAHQDFDPFRPALHPPSVTPSATLAMDDGLVAANTWATGQTQANVSEGLQFLGFAYLSELTQRPEYRRVSETIAGDMTRRWIKLQASGDDDKTEKLKTINDALNRLKVRDVFRKAAEHDGFFGRSHVYLDFGAASDDELKTSIGSGEDDASRSKVKRGSLARLKNIEAVWCYPMGYNSTDPLSPDWYSPQTWLVQGRQVHGSRLLTFVGREMPDMLKPAYSFGGLSLSQMVKPYVDNWLRTRQSTADLVGAFSVSGIKLDLVSALNADGSATGLFERVALFNALRDNRGTMVLNKDEEFFNVSTPLGTLDALQAQSQEHICSASGIPLVKLTGITPSGLNASSDGEIRTWYDWIHSYQEHLFRPALTRLLWFVQLSEFGAIDPDIGFEFEHLWSMNEKEKADVRKTEADTDQVLIDSGVILSSEARQRVAGDPETPYAGLDPSLDIDPPDPGELDPAPDPVLNGLIDA